MAQIVAIRFVGAEGKTFCYNPRQPLQVSIRDYPEGAPSDTERIMDGRTGVALQHRENPRTIPPKPQRESRISPRVRRILLRRRAEEDDRILQPKKYG